mgnify:FL=1
MHNELVIKVEVFNFMNLYKYFKVILNKITCFDCKAVNPFTSKDFHYNPFDNAFNQTYVWLEKEKK